MKLRKIAGTAVFVIAAMGLASGTSYADPASEPAPSNITYETKLVDKAVVTTLDAGVFKVASDSKTVTVNDMNGNAVVTLPLAVNLDQIAIPLNAAVKNDGKVLELTPAAPIASTKPLFVQPVASPIENQRAMETFATQFGIATAIGGFVGTAGGAIIGGILGGIAGCATILLCLPGIATGAGVGAVIGTIIVGGPALVVAGIDLIGTLTAPPGTTKWNYVEPGVGGTR
ncbi:ammonium transporter [Antrihabitans sp. YC3-6]|uniref:Ammonium transporter n=1 Tax=Antrihabitans stalagmiti TaxID=2799499 RepID=A0A934NQB4_9NOCA|nr:ammonium transporter [Antrihabitans stalagmiti]MBJ8339476.1 ammonium transporter [Antrihabitans stalagmiti]